ncbi:melanophilin-like [Pseudoliparis swirei]|uniref:melanophilin-like n=1 Tax=Pseudoliparis swirei TaxID=2059687 RepID=UPI0024BE350F|nr:melanophilin-like [Pseudoliparis swirei]
MELDLSRLSDAEAEHVWDVIQRDFNLRKTEEERLGGLKTRIQQEDRKQLGARCLLPFRFLLTSRRSCLDCHLFTCKSCSRDKREHGWVCDTCHMTRVLKIGTVGWYHDDVRNRFRQPAPRSWSLYRG